MIGSIGISERNRLDFLQNFSFIPFPGKNVSNARNTIYLGTSDVGKYTRAKIREKKIHLSRYNLYVLTF